MGTKRKTPFVVAVAEPVVMKLPAETHPDGRAGLITHQEYVERVHFGHGPHNAKIKITTMAVVEP